MRMRGRWMMKGTVSLVISVLTVIFCHHIESIFLFLQSFEESIVLIRRRSHTISDPSHLSILLTALRTLMLAVRNATLVETVHTQKMNGGQT